MKLKISELISKIDEKNRHYFLLGALLFIFLLDYFILMRPQLVTLTKINPEIKLLSQDIEKAQEDIGKLGFYQTEVKRLESQLAQTSQKIKSKKKCPLSWSKFRVWQTKIISGSIRSCLLLKSRRCFWKTRSEPIMHCRSWSRQKAVIMISDGFLISWKKMTCFCM